MKTNKGFTLIEVLIAMLVLATGLLGLAGLQATGIRSNLSAYHRTQATQLAYSMADRMRANVADASLLGASVYTTLDADAAAVQAGCMVVGGCTPAQMAQQDLFEWYGELTNTVALPNAAGTITVAGSLFTITVSWDDDRDAGTANLNFTMSFQL